MKQAAIVSTELDCELLWPMFDVIEMLGINQQFSETDEEWLQKVTSKCSMCLENAIRFAYRNLLAQANGIELKPAHAQLYDPILIAYAEGASIQKRHNFFDINMVGIPLARDKFFNR